MPPKRASASSKRHEDPDELLLLERAILAAQAAKHHVNPDQLVAKAKGGMTEKQLHQLEQLAAQAESQRHLQSLYVEEVKRQHVARQHQLYEQRAAHSFAKLENTAWFESAPGKWVRFQQFDVKTTELQQIVDLMTKNLSEPYNIFTYEHFIVEYPDLCVCAYGVESATKPATENEGGVLVGCISSKVALKKGTPLLRGYIAMLAVDPSFRGARLGTKLILETIKLMRAKSCIEAYLETPTHNERALKLYTDLGFIKSKFLCKYYIDKSDAVRLKLFLGERAKAPQAATGDEAAVAAPAAAVAAA